MRKLLLATTALTAAGLIAGASRDAAAQMSPDMLAQVSPDTVAQAAPGQYAPGDTGMTRQKATDVGSAPPAPAPTTYTSKSAERIKLQLSGYFQQWGVFTNQNFRTRQATATSLSPTASLKDQDTAFATQKHNSEICFIGQTTLDNGLTIGVNVQMEANTSSDQIDESYLFLQSPTAGQLILGDENNAGYLLHVTAPDGGISLDSGDLTNINAFEVNGAPVFDTPLSSTYLRLMDNDSGKFTYITPRFAGLQAGISYIPLLNRYGGDTNSSLTKLGTQSGGAFPNTGLYNGIAPGLNYTGVFGDLGVQASVGYMFAETGSGYSGTPAINGAPAHPGADTKNLVAYNAGAQFSFAGFSVGGAWMYVPQGTANIAASGISNGVYTGSSGLGKLNGIAWTVGAAYEFGPYKLGIDYQYGTNNAVSGGGESHLTQGVVSGTYTMGPGIRLVGGVFTYDWDQENNLSKNSGVGGATALKLAF